MFENLVHQEVSKALAYDIKNNFFPRSVLFSGEEATGKLTAAFEISRVLNCRGKDKRFNCNCFSCMQQKALTATNIMLLGPRNCSLEIASSYDIFIKAVENNYSYIEAARYLFLRSVRKLTLRFNSILWEGETKIRQFENVLVELNEDLETLDFPRALPPLEELKKLCADIVKLSYQLENQFLYDSIPINLVRNLENWTHEKADAGKKIIILENAERIQVSARNALLKILEEPPADCVFILLTSKRNSIMETILSRVRTYDFKNRSLEQQKDVMKFIFHNESFSGSINDFLLSQLSVLKEAVKISCKNDDSLLKHLPVEPEIIIKNADLFYDTIANRQIPNVSEIIKACSSFELIVELKIFLNRMAEKQRKLMTSSAGCEFSVKYIKLLQQTWDNITTYNQNPTSAFEALLRDISALNSQFNFIMKF